VDAIVAASGGRTAAAEEWRHGWRLVLASLLGIMFSFMSMAAGYTLGVLTGPLVREFGWSRQQVLAVTFVQLLGVLPAGFLVGWIADRYGVRRVIAVSQVGLGLSFMALGVLTRDLNTFYALYFVLALVSAGTLPTTFMKALTGAFTAHRGLAIGIALAGSGLCGLLVPRFTAWAVEQHGWRGAYVAVGLLPIAIALPAALWAFRDSDTPAARNAGAVARGLPPAVAVRDFRFWCMGLAFFLASGAATAVLTSFVPLLVDGGFSAAEAASIMGAVGISVIVGRLAVGALVDRLWAPLVGALFVVPAAIAAAGLGAWTPGTGGAIAAAIAIGLATGAEFDLTAYLVSRYFGLTHFATLYAAIYVLFALGGGLAGPLFGWSYDHSGGYAAGLYGVAGAYVGCGLLLLLLGPYRREFSPPPSASTR
jgi:MFS family permease